MGGSTKKAVNQLGRNVKHIVGEKAYNVTKQLTGTGLLQTYTNLLTGKSVRESLSENISVGFNDHLLEKPQKEVDDKPAAVDTAALAAAMDEEEQKRKKKRGFAANVFGSDFRFGASAHQNKTDGTV